MLKEQSIIKSQAGFSVAEAVIAAAVLTVFISGIATALVTINRNTQTSGHKQQAVMLAEEALEASRNIRDNGFSNLVDGSYGLATTTNQWNFSGSSDQVGIFTRQTTVSTIAANQKQISSTVSWQDASLSRSVSLSEYLTNWQAAVGGNWSSCTQGTSLDISGSQDGLKIQTQGSYAYLVRGGSSSNFLIVDVSNSLSPALTGSLDLPGAPTNIAVSGNYAYVSSSNNSSELEIIDISNPSSPSVVGTYNAAGNADGYGVYVNGTTVYLVRASSSSNEFFIVNASNPASPSLLGSLDLGSDGNEVYVSGNYSYIASASNSQELQVVNISTPGAPSLAGSLNLSGNENALSISGFGSTVVLGRSNDILYVISASTPSLPVEMGTYDTGGNVNDISLGNSNTYAFIADTDQTAEFQIIDISNPSSPILVCSTDLSGQVDLQGIAYSSSLNQAFGAGSSNSEELVIISPQ